MKKMREYLDNKTILIFILIMFLFTALFLFSGKRPHPIVGNTVTLSRDEGVYIDAYSDGIEIHDYLIEKPFEGYSEDELNLLFEKCSKELLCLILNGSEDFFHIQSNMFFPQKLDEYPFNISYEILDDNLIDSEGVILCGEQFDTSIHIYMSYDSFEGSFSIPVHVEPDVDTEKQIRRNDLEKSLTSAINDENAMIKNESGYVVNLPDSVNGKEVFYSISGKKRNAFYLLLGPAICILLLAAKRRDINTEKKKKDDEILSEYPKMIQKMALFLVSGMTIRNIWILLGEEAPKKAYDNRLYEEMRISGNELRSGIMESLVYKQFGERLNVPEIVRFAALLSQNVKKGSTKLSDQLQEESKKAFEGRKQRAIKKGEEAGTLLLGPMMMLLVDVMIMIILPAFWNI